MVSSVRCLLAVSLLSSSYVTAHPAHGREELDHVDSFYKSLPSQWYHDEDHPVTSLFKRQSSPTPGSAEWAAQYPPIGGTLTGDHLLPEWLAALHAAEAAGLIPNISVATISGDGNPVYPNGANPSSPEICSSTEQCREPDDIWDGPDGTVSIGFDDGPEAGSAVLYDFLKQQNIPSTHFMIGGNIVSSYPLFQRAFSELNADIAVHTWDHRYMTTLSNELALAELAWTMQIIADSTGGRIPKYWRPPYGDSDNRIRAIAKEVLGLTQINWNQDSEDWTISDGTTTRAAVHNAISGWYAGPKSPGLIILEHELTPDTAGAFIDSYPDINKNGWKILSTVDAKGNGGWKNADSNTGNVQSMSIIAASSSQSSSTNVTVAPVNNQVASGTVISTVTSSPHSATSTTSKALSSATAEAARPSQTNSASRLLSSLGFMLLLPIMLLSSF